VHVIATAGHVDHGKSMLVRALTGMEPDRWEAEQRRGMTIDLGFAWMTLPSGERIAFVDVPGHERFVSNMLAGAGPAPAVMFVVAADEGWMPQSAEHLAAIDALGVRAGILVITRADLADPEPARRQAMAQLAGTSLGPDIETVAVSAVTGQGLPELIDALTRLTGRLPAPDPRSAVRLWVDRVFAIKGSGTVITGTLQAGTVRVGDELMLTPAMRPLRIRGIQSLGAPATQVSGVARVALNLRGVSTRELSRGMALVRPGQWTLTEVIDVRLARHPRQEPGAQDQHPAAGQEEVRLPPQLTLHIGAARTVARVRLLGGGIVRLSLAQALPLHVGDRVLLRDPGAAGGHASASPNPAAPRGVGLDPAAPRSVGLDPAIPRGVGPNPATPRSVGLDPATPRSVGLDPATPPYGRPIYGATVLDVMPPRLRGTGAAAAAQRELASWPDPPTAGDLLRRHRLLRAGAASAMGLRDLPPPVSGDWLADTEHWQRLQGLLAGAVTAHAKRDPLAAGLPVDAARTKLGLPDRGLVEALAAAQEGDGAGPVRLSGGYLRTGGAAGAAQPEMTPAVRAVLADLAGAPFRAPDAARLQEVGLDPRAAAAAERAGLLLRLPGNVVLAAGAAGQAARILAELPQPFTAAEARQALETTRRVAIPLLERLDRDGITRRLPDDRRVMREPPGS
jgi:selenocysteine-specific elongation factor